jgi:chemotaxis protein methyltransferase CheR
MSVAVAPLARTPQGDDYTRFCEGVRRLTGIDLLQYKRAQMERRIRTFAQRRGTGDLNAYLQTLGGDATEREAFLDRVTINVSQLWRNPEQWTALARDIVPEIVQNGRVRAWSAGCSYGAEAYTLAALCLETVPGCRPEIHGTDIDARMIARARDGRFSDEDARTAPPELLRRWFDRDGDGWKAKRQLAGLMRFDQGDLLRMPFPAGRYDLVMCRNTVIYFNEDVRDALHTRLAGAIRPGGYLLIGSTERVADPKAGGLELVRPFLYRKQ